MLSKLSLSALERFRDHGLLILRVGIGLSFMAHGWPKLVGGSEKWVKVGSAMAHLGIDFGHEFWGLMAALTEFGGGILFALGLLTRPVALSLVFTMLVAMVMHIAKDHPFTKTSHSLELGIVFLAMLFVGPGRFSLDKKLGLTDAE